MTSVGDLTQETTWDGRGRVDEEVVVSDDASSTSSSPSIPDENINFDLVYALHTFVATVDGQASVVKGDALILLEDTNIYWWLVEVLKTREVGYIPAENIETPYERLARLNKHRNVEITSPANCKDMALPSVSMTRKMVTIGEESTTVVIHYEVESDEDEDDDDDEDDIREGDGELDEDERLASKSTTTAMATAAAAQGTALSRDSTELTAIEEAPELSWPAQAKDTASGDAPSLRVFAGNLGQSPPQAALFHTFEVTMATTADELVTVAVSGFGAPTADPTLDDCTVEHYLTVQGMDGDEYVLAPQDKPWAIFKTLTAPLTTPMPSPHALAAPGHGGGMAPSSRRARSSSFSSYEQTHYDEDSVFRFYLHRRIKRAHESEGLIYIKVSLYPDEASSVLGEDEVAAAIDTAHTATREGVSAMDVIAPAALEGTKKKKKGTSRQEMDRIDKIIAVRLETRVGEVINTALSKLHVPDAEADGFQASTAVSSVREMTLYRLSVRAHGKETHLRPNEMMSTVLHQQQSSSPNDGGPVSGDLLFVLRRAIGVTGDHQQHSPSPRVGAAAGYHSKNPGLAPLEVAPHEEQRRRPSILDILMDSPHREEARPSTPLSPLPRQERTSSLGMYSYHQQYPHHEQQQQVPGMLSPGGEGISHQGQQQHLHPFSAANGSVAHLTFRRSSAPSPSSSSSTHDTGDMSSPLSADPTRRSKKESSFKQQLKRLVGWGSSSKTKKATTATTPASPMHPHSQASSPLPSPSPSMSSFHPPHSPMLSPTVHAAPAMMRSPSATSSTLSPMMASHPLDPPSSQSHAASVDTLSTSAKTQVERDEMLSRADKRPVSVASSVSSGTCSSISTLQKAGDGLDDDDDDDSSEDEDEEADDDKTSEATEARTPLSHSLAETPKGGPSLTDIQVQYAMWMDSQKSNDVPAGMPLTTPLAPSPAHPKRPPPEKKKEATLSASPSSASNTTTSTNTEVTASSSAASSCASQKTAEKTDTPTIQEELSEKVAPAPVAPPATSEGSPNDLGDLYLLVAHGVEYLESRESSRWEEDTGYQFHPWNRPDGSFTVRDKQKMLKTNVMNGEEGDATRTAETGEEEERRRKEALTLLATGHTPSPPPPTPTTITTPDNVPESVEEAPLSPPLTPQPRQQPATNSSKVELHTPEPPKNETDDEELQRIVAAHILF